MPKAYLCFSFVLAYLKDAEGPDAPTLKLIFEIARFERAPELPGLHSLLAFGCEEAPQLCSDRTLGSLFSSRRRQIVAAPTGRWRALAWALVRPQRLPEQPAARPATPRPCRCAGATHPRCAGAAAVARRDRGWPPSPRRASSGAWLGRLFFMAGARPVPAARRAPCRALVAYFVKTNSSKALKISTD